MIMYKIYFYTVLYKMFKYSVSFSGIACKLKINGVLIDVEIDEIADVEFGDSTKKFWFNTKRKVITRMQTREKGTFSLMQT